MKDILQKAKALVEKGEIKEALDLLKSISTQVKCAFSKCPSCGIDAPMLQKGEALHGECKSCGAVWGGKSVEELVKLGDNMKDEKRRITKKEVEAKLWDMYRNADPDADAFSINQFAATGWLKKTLAIKLGLPIPEENLAKAEGGYKAWVSPEGTEHRLDPSEHHDDWAHNYHVRHGGGDFEPSEAREALIDAGWKMKGIKDAGTYPVKKSDGDKFVSESMARTIKCTLKKGDSKGELIEEHERLVDVLKNPAKDKLEDEAKIQSKELAEMKEEVKKSDHDMTKDEVIDTMLQMFKAGEEPALINRHSIAKYETVGEINDDVLKAVFRKAKRDYHALYKAVEAEELEKYNITAARFGAASEAKRSVSDKVFHAVKPIDNKAHIAPKKPFGTPVKPKVSEHESMHQQTSKPSETHRPKGEVKKVAFLPKQHQDMLAGKKHEKGWISEGHDKGKATGHEHVKPIDNKAHIAPKKPFGTPVKPKVSEHESMHQQTSKPSETHRPKGPSLPAKFEKAEEKLCKECKGSMGKGVNSVLMKDGLCKACSVKKTDQKSPRGRDVVPEGELKEKMKEADEHTGPLKPIVKK